MIRAAIFDLDGTLVQTERLKALSYARAAVDLCPYTLAEATVIDAFKDVVGLSRREVATHLVERFDLQEKAAALMDQFGVSTPWQAYVQVRLRHYHALIADPDVLRSNQWPHNVAVLEAARADGCQTALATKSRCEQATRVLDILGWADRFNFIATRDDVTHSKPDPEIYLLVLSELAVDPQDAFVLEDSPSRVQAALAPEIAHVFAVTTPCSRDRIRSAGLLP
ncbi:MAG: HAD family hydrolase [Anaerolineae bacterium]